MWNEVDRDTAIIAAATYQIGGSSKNEQRMCFFDCWAADMQDNPDAIRGEVERFNPASIEFVRRDPVLRPCTSPWELYDFLSINE